LFKLTWKDSGYKGGPLPEDAMEASGNNSSLSPSWPFHGWTANTPGTATGTADTPGGLGAILTQVNKDGKFFAISFASRQLKDHEKITLLSSWRPPSLSREWTISMSTSKGKNSYCTRTTNLWRNWATSTAKL